MKKDEIIKLLKEGNTITEHREMIFKYGKLQRGSKYSYSIKDIMITSRQFEAIRHMIHPLLFVALQDREYKLKDFYHEKERHS